MRFTVHQLQLNTCADSARAFIELVQCIVRGDDIDDGDDIDSEAHSTLGERSLEVRKLEKYVQFNFEIIYKIELSNRKILNMPSRIRTPNL